MKFFFCLFLIFCTFINIYADDRRFTYVYETVTLPKNIKELEVWTSYRGGRDYFYSALEHRMEFEIGLSAKLQTAFYLNLKSETSANSITGDYETEFEWEGISSEWKYQALNKYKDWIGFAPYLELGLNNHEVKLETKLIFDKNISKKFIAAFNVVAEYEWGFNPAPTRTSKALELEFNLGLAYDITPHFSIGLEARNINEIPNGEGLEYSALFAGPNISYKTDKWYFAMTYMPQLPALKRSKENETSKLILNDKERNNARLILGFTL